MTLPAASSTLSQIKLLAQLLAPRDEKTGKLWEATIIRAGQSLAGENFPAAVLKESAQIFAGLPVRAMRFGDDASAEDADSGFHHLPDEAGDPSKVSAGNVIGQVTEEVWWDEASQEIRGLVAIDDKTWQERLLAAHKRGGIGNSAETDVLGFSIVADVLRLESTNEVVKIVKGNFLDVVTAPAAGGMFRTVKAEVPPVKTKTKQEDLQQAALMRMILEEARNRLSNALFEDADKSFEERRQKMLETAQGLVEALQGGLNMNSQMGMAAIQQALGQTKQALRHASNPVDTGEPEWGEVNKTELPDNAFADFDARSFPHHFVRNAQREEGKIINGDMHLHTGGLDAAWAAAMGARTGQRASPSIISHLREHRKALGLEESKASTAMEDDVDPKELKKLVAEAVKASMDETKGAADAIGTLKAFLESLSGEERSAAIQRVAMMLREMGATGGEQETPISQDRFAELTAELQAIHQEKDSKIRKDRLAKVVEEFGTSKEEDPRDMEIKQLKQSIRDGAIKSRLAELKEELKLEDAETTLKLADLSGVIVESGKVAGLKVALEAVTKDRPYLVKQEKTPEQIAAAEAAAADANKTPEQLAAEKAAEEVAANAKAAAEAAPKDQADEFASLVAATVKESIPAGGVSDIPEHLKNRIQELRVRARGGDLHAVAEIGKIRQKFIAASV